MNFSIVLKILCYFVYVIIQLVFCQEESASDELLKTVFSYRDMKVDPCDNFYKYACGNWTNIYDQNEPFKDTFTMINYKANNQSSIFLEWQKQNPRIMNNNKFFREVLNYYTSCQNMNSITYDYSFYMNTFMKHVDPSSNLTSNEAWFHLYHTAVKYGMNSLFWEYKSTTTIKKTFIIHKPLFFETIEKMGRSDSIFNHFEKILNQFQDFEEELEKIYEVVDETQHTTSVNLTELNMQWITNILKIELNQTKLDDNIDIIIKNTTYLQNVWNFLKVKDPFMVGRYILLRFVIETFDFETKGFTNIECTENTREQFPLAMNWLYEQQMDESLVIQKTKDITEIFEKLLNKFIQTIGHNRFDFDDEIQQLLLKKLQKLSLKIGNIPRRNTTETIEKYYKDLKLDPYDFYENMLELKKFYKQKSSDVRNNTDIEDYFFSEDSTVACSSMPYYVTDVNIIIVPLAGLQMPLYHTNSKKSLMYGSIGFLLAHEIGHAYQQIVLAFDQNNKLVGPLQQNENKLFEQNFKCLRSGEPEIAEEKISDVIGLRLAYETLFETETTSSDYEKQLFFLGVASSFCGDIQSDKTDNVHGTNMGRINYAISNFNQFPNVYNCSKNSQMNLEQNCNIFK